MPFFTARNRQNPFAERKRREREQQEADQETAAILADSDAMEAAAEAEAEPVAVPFDRNPESEEYVQAPDISTYDTGGVVPQTTVEDVMIGEHGTEAVVPLSHISAETQAKIDAVLNKAIPPVADERPDHPGPRGAEHMRPLRESAPVADETKRGRGRPRPQETIDRDNAVHALLATADADAGVSKEALAIALDEKEQQVYSSLRQLSKEGRAETRYVKGLGYRWFAL